MGATLRSALGTRGHDRVPTAGRDPRLTRERRTEEHIETPAITIGIPVYNRAALIRKALDSALREREADLEVLVVDNASDDGTWEVLRSYCDPRIRLVRNDRNVGLFGNFNRCIELARGRYLCTLCSDDVLLEDFLPPARRLLDLRPDVSLVSSRGRAIDERRGRTFMLGSNLPGGIYSSEDAVVAVLWAFCTYYTNPFNYPSGILMRTETARAAGGMDESLGFAADVKLYLAMLERSALAIVDTIGCEVLMHSEQENEKIYRDLRHIREFTDHFVRYAGVIERHGLRAYTRAHVGGYLLGSYAQLRRRGRPTVAAECLALFRELGLPTGPALRGLIDSVRRRADLRRAGRLRSPVPVAALPPGAGVAVMEQAR